MKKTPVFLLLLVGVALLVSLAVSPDGSRAADDSKITIVYSSNLLGYMEPCGCEETDEHLGGLYKKATYLDEYRKTHPGIVIVDSGDLLTEEESIAPSVEPSAKMKAECVVEIFKNIGIDAVNVGEFDLVMGVNYLKELAKKYDFPFISSNLVDAGGKYIFPRYIIKKVGNKNVGIFGLISDTGDIPGKVKEFSNGEASVTDTMAAATSMIEELKGKVDYIVALTHQQANRDWILARRVTGIDIIVSGHDKQRTNDPINVDDKALIVRAGEKGQFLGIFEADLGAGKSFNHEQVPLGNSVAEKPEIVAMIREYDERIFNMFGGNAQEGVNPADGAVLRSEKCGTCHANQLAKWKTTGHAKAYNTLFGKRMNYDPSCLTCHTVRFEQPGGFNMNDQPMSLVHVQCEVCHGDATEHMTSFSAEKIPNRKPTIDDCAKCHTPYRSPTLIDGAKVYMDKIKH